MLKGAGIWTLWLERNRLIFKGSNCKSVRNLGGSIISLIKFWCQAKGNSYIDNLHLVVPPNVNSLPMQITASNLSLMPIEEEDMFGAELD
jgi:hypothetical protein